MCIIGKRPKLHVRLLVYSLSYCIVAGFLLEKGTIPLFRYTNFHTFTCFFTTDLWVYYELRVYYELTT